MRTAALVLALFALNACSNAIVGASFNSNAVVPPVSSSQTTVRIVGTNGVAAGYLIAWTSVGVLAFAAFVDAGDPGYARASPSFNAPSGAFWARPVPELDPGRKVSEQDCTKPLDLSQGNIRCK